MLIDFSVENFKSIKELKTFTMVATSINDKIEHTIGIDSKIKLLKSTSIYGPNGSGKSNLLDAMGFMKFFVLNSSEMDFKKAKNALFLQNNLKPFKLNTKTEKSPSIFEVNFFIDNVRYRYGFELDYNIVHSEWLFSYPKVRERQLFLRKKQEIEYNNQFFKEAKDFVEKIDDKDIVKKTRDNALFLSVLANFNGEISLKIIDWFNQFNITSNAKDDGVGNYTTHLILENDKYKDRVLNLLKVADLGINDIEIKSLNPDDFSNEIKDLLNDMPDVSKSKFSNIQVVDKKTKHIKYDENNNYLGYENFDLEEESMGTQKFFNMCGPIIDVLEKGEILVIDELDNSFHTLMSEFVVKLFNSNETNPNNAQLIFATHDTNLLTQELFRRDQIWFVEKDIFGASDIYSLADFGARKDTALEKNYLSGKYGAIPFFGQLDFLKED